MNLAPSYIASVVAILFNIQGLIGLSLTSNEITGFVTVVCALVVAVRQITNGRSTVAGSRPK